jgi:PAS domain-containing protein
MGKEDLREARSSEVSTKGRLDTPMLRSLIDALPSMLFVIDEDITIVDLNAASAEFLASSPASLTGGRPGNVLECIHVGDVSGGCGFGPFCKDCVIRNSVLDAFSGSKIVRRRTKIGIIRDAQNVELHAFVTASTFVCDGKRFVLLVIEDISEIAELRRIIPICSVCKKVRNEKEAWQRVEAYFKGRWDIDFSHGLCPECLENEMKKLNDFSGKK